MKKTLTFAAIHFSIAFTVAYLLTGDILIGGLIAMIEPMVNTVAFYFHERVWLHLPQLRKLARSAAVKTTSFAVVHYSVAFGVAYVLTGSWWVGGIMAAIEPSINTVAYYVHERIWQMKQQGACLFAKV
ncbi:DUF2061 domain-containing protein [Vibrio ostreicida]|uniref:DUF2061 domain-containing protein n=1 Tax=Vibrio ostreicida TaxID=526588 RepID=A0ABT8BNN2_9VIBR|nr:DUF2061 domain-containing protein [Vibrio ostreicida]MDN3608274.1 DUF2061 domain-containing protein [Vibrio ostreicida]NPD09742.1 DUF2061 domain-containing protein [Vibrio ostreicida]